MLNHRTVLLLYLAGLTTLFCLNWMLHTSVWIGIIVLSVLFLKIEFLGAYFIQLNFHLKSINHLDRFRKQIALTFDDGPEYPQTQKVIEVLGKFGVKATFFVIGKKIKGNETLISELMEQGHQIGSHSYSHDFWIDLWSSHKLEADLQQSLEAIQRVTGKSPTLFRPPYGVTTPRFRKAIRKLNLKSIGWDVRSFDTSTNGIPEITKRVLSKTRNGSIILLHDRLDLMPDLLERLIPELKARNYEFVTINELQS
jgi:peptidoglycan/xylan/chitin deacetylase (PgdA/CDA1 family)